MLSTSTRPYDLVPLVIIIIIVVRFNFYGRTILVIMLRVIPSSSADHEAHVLKSCNCAVWRVAVNMATTMLLPSHLPRHQPVTTLPAPIYGAAKTLEL